MGMIGALHIGWHTVQDFKGSGRHVEHWTMSVRTGNRHGFHWGSVLVVYRRPRPFVPRHRVRKFGPLIDLELDNRYSPVHHMYWPVPEHEDC